MSRSPSASRALARCRRELERWGLLMLSDARYPSVASIAAGAPAKGSWWMHPAGAAIFHGATALADECASAKLVDGKVVFLHRRLWPALAGAGSGRAVWQTRGLGAAALALLRRVERAGELAASGALAKALEERLLVVGAEEHTETGAHARVLMSWKLWCSRSGVRPDPKGRAALESAFGAWRREFGGDGRLPWERPARIEPAEGRRVEAVRRLFREYAADVGDCHCFEGFEREVRALPGGYGGKAGRLLLALDGSRPAGCVGLRKVQGGTAEMKRLYVRPEFRGSGLGRRLVERALYEAKAAGYRRLVLDTLPAMKAARALYAELGFTASPPYWDNPTPGALCLQKKL